MDYWSGWMNWKIDPQWQCEICGGRALTWGLAHAQCRCNNCHAHYSMRDAGGAVVDTPISQTRPEFRDAARAIYAARHCSLDEIIDAEWIAAGVPKELFDDDDPM